MPHGTVLAIMPAASCDVFRLLHDYDRRLEWDTLLSAAYLEEGSQAAQLHALAVCRGRAQLGGIEMRTEYVSFKPPHVAAVKMVNRPPLFHSFAATIRHRDLPGGQSELEYKYHFTARPRWLRWILHPLLSALFRHETKRRLAALRRFLARQSTQTGQTKPA